MKRKSNGLPQRYQAALRQYLQQDPRPSLESAQDLGRQAVALELKASDVARIHEAALAAVEASGSRNGLIKRAGSFFVKVITPIEQMHRAALIAGARLTELNSALDQRTRDVAASNRALKKGIASRKTAEMALKESAGRCKSLVEESLTLQEHLQHLTHRILSAQEDKRKKISHDLQDDIGQTLLGINVRLLSLKKATGRNTKSFQEEIAGTQQVVVRSARTIERFAREYAKHHEP
jgi:signal transduction histidine kinase